MKLSWIRTEIGGRTAPHDFAALDAGTHVGRIYKHDTHGGPANWFWAMTAIGPGINRADVNCSGTVATRAEAVRLVEETYQRCREPNEPPVSA